MSLKYKNILITGGAGFIGSNLVASLSKYPVKLTVLDNLSTGNLRNISSFTELDFIDSDIRDDLSKLFSKKRFDCVIHLAALGSVPRSILNPLDSFTTNVTGTLNILEQLKHTAVPIIFASSSSVYGDLNDGDKSENMKTLPISPYGSTKLSAESFVRTYSINYDINSISFRFFNVFGPKQNPYGDYAAVIPKFINLALSKQDIEVFGDGKQTRDFTYVQDVVDTVLAVLSKNIFTNNPLNLCFGAEISINELISTIKKVGNLEFQIKYSEPRNGDIKFSKGASTYFTSLFPEIARTNFDLAMEATIKSLKNLHEV
jgi:UDP-glucose 4-epimerase